MSLKNQITEDMKAAMRARRLRAFRRFACCWQPSSSVKSTRRIELDDGAVLAVVES